MQKVAKSAITYSTNTEMNKECNRYKHPLNRNNALGVRHDNITNKKDHLLDRKTSLVDQPP